VGNALGASEVGNALGASEVLCLIHCIGPTWVVRYLEGGRERGP